MWGKGRTGYSGKTSTGLFGFALFALWLFALLSWPLPAHAQTSEELSLQQTRLSSALREALTGSRQSMMELERYYHGLIAELRDSLERQSGELTTLSDYLTSTMNSFRSLSAELQNSSMALAVERDRRARLERILLLVGIAGAAVLVGKGAFLALYYGRGIRVPAWLKIIV